ncbi:MAG: hypothetical protein AAFZ17_21380 [Cyanobacteria bacterium J06650_10]
MGCIASGCFVYGGVYRWQVGGWKPLVRSRNAKFYQALGVTYWVETMLVFALYWLGRGGATVLRRCGALAVLCFSGTMSSN